MADGKITLQLEADVVKATAGLVKLGSELKSQAKQVEVLRQQYEQSQEAAYQANAAMYGSQQSLYASLSQQADNLIAENQKLIQLKAIIDKGNVSNETGLLGAYSLSHSDIDAFEEKLADITQQAEQAKAKMAEIASQGELPPGDPEILAQLTDEETKLNELKTAYNELYAKRKESSDQLLATPSVSTDDTKNLSEFEQTLEKCWQIVKSGEDGEFLYELYKDASQAQPEVAQLYEQLYLLKEALRLLSSAGLGPGFEEFDKVKAAIDETQQKIREFSGEAEKEPSKAFKVMSAVGKTALTGLKVSISAVKTVFSTMASGAVKAVSKLGAPFKNLTGAVTNFGKRLKQAVTQGLIFRPLRNAMTQLTQSFSSALKENQAFAASLANLKGTALTAFSPIFDAIIPVLTKLMNVIANIITYISTLINMFFGLSNASGKVSKGLANMGSSASGAGKDAKKASQEFASFDTIKTLGKDDSSSGGGGDTVSPTFGQDFSKAATDLEDVKALIESGDWEALGAKVGTTLNGITSKANSWLTEKFIPFCTTLSTDLTTFLNGLMSTLDGYDIGAMIANLLNGITSAFTTFTTTFNWGSAGELIASTINGFFETYDFATLGTGIGAFLAGIITMITSFFTNTDWNLVFGQLVVGLNAVLAELLKIDWTAFFGSIAGFLATGINKLLTDFDWIGLTDLILDGLSGLIQGFSQLIRDIDWEQLGKDVVDILWEICKKLPQLLLDLLVLIGEILVALIDILVGIFKECWEGIKNVFSGVGEWWEKNVTQPIYDTVSGWWDSIVGFFSGIWEGIKKVFSAVGNWWKNKVSGPIVEKTQKAKESVKTAFSNAWSGVKNAWNKAGSWFKTNVTDKVSEKFTAVTSSVKEGGITNLMSNSLSKVKDAWGSVGDWFKTNVTDKLSEKFENATSDNQEGGITNLMSTSLSKVQDVWGKASEWFSTNVTGPVSDKFSELSSETDPNGITNFMSTSLGKVQDAWGKASDWFKTNVTGPVSEKFGELTSDTEQGGIQKLFSGAWTGLSTAWSTVSNWFGENVTGPIAAKFGAITDGKDSIGDKFEAVWKSIKNGAISMVNSVIAKIESFINSIIDGINRLITGANDLSSNIGIPAIPTISHVSLPRLPAFATGAVVNPSHPFAAILGDNRHEQEVVSPLSTMKQAFMEAIADSGLNTRGGTINLQIDGTTFARITNPYMAKETSRLGIKAIGGL